MANKKFFTKPEVDLLVERQELKKQLIALNQKLDPLVKAACDELGHGIELKIGKRTVLLERIKASVTTWRTLAHAVASDEDILEVKSLHTEQRVTRRAKVS